MSNEILFKQFTNALANGTEADLQEAERMVALSYRVEDGKEAMSELKEQTTTVASNDSLVAKLNAMLTDASFSLPSDERYPTAVDFIDGIGFDGEKYFIEDEDNIGTEFIGNDWKEFKAHAKAQYEANHCNHKAVGVTLDMLKDKMANDALNTTFSKNTIKVLKTGQLSVNIKAKVGQRKVSAGKATGADILATMQARLAKAKKQ